MVHSKKITKKLNTSNNLTGFTFIETVVVVGIIATLLLVAMVRFTSTQESNELDSAANLVQSALTEAREKSYAPKPSTDISQQSDVNGYGFKFDFNNKKEVAVFEDKVDSANPQNENRWVDPASTTVDDVILKTYKFSDSNINLAEIFRFEQNGGGEATSIGLRSIVFKTSELPSGRMIYYYCYDYYIDEEGNYVDTSILSSNFNTISVVLRHTVNTSLTEKVIVNFKTGEIKIE